jgi:hypothetical protein
MGPLAGGLHIQNSVHELMNGTAVVEEIEWSSQFTPLSCRAKRRLYVAYMSPMNFWQLSPAFGRIIGERSAPVVGFSVVLGIFR